MSIKQTGGVFGRNPTFNDVTIDGTLTFDGDIDINSDLKIDGDLEVNGKTTINNGSESIAIAAVNTAGNNNIVMANSVGSSKIMANGANLWLYTDGNASSATASGATLGFQLDGSQNARLPYGNLVIGTSGKGIDFSATSGTGTSELFDDYEEGTFVPVGFGITYSTASGVYTKIGNTVIWSAVVTFPTTADTNVSRVTLPFAVGAGNENRGNCSISYNGGGISNLTALPSGGVSYVTFSVGATPQTNANLSTDTIFLGGSYKV